VLASRKINKKRIKLPGSRGQAAGRRLDSKLRPRHPERSEGSPLEWRPERSEGSPVKWHGVWEIPRYARNDVRWLVSRIFDGSVTLTRLLEPAYKNNRKPAQTKWSRQHT